MGFRAAPVFCNQLHGKFGAVAPIGVPLRAVNSYMSRHGRTGLETGTGGNLIIRVRWERNSRLLPDVQRIDRWNGFDLHLFLQGGPVRGQSDRSAGGFRFCFDARGDGAIKLCRLSQNSGIGWQSHQIPVCTPEFGEAPDVRTSPDKMGCYDRNEISAFAFLS